MRNPRRKHTVQIHKHEDPSNHNNQIKICNRYQNKPQLDIGTAGCLIPIEKEQIDSNENNALMLSSEIVWTATAK